MQALVFHGPHRLALEDVPRPQPASDEVLIQVAYSGICGSDLHGYLGHSARRSAHTPLIMGHEFTGRIVEMGSAVNNQLHSGERVVVQPQISCGHCRACRAGLANICPNMAIIGIERAGAFAQFVTVPAHRIFRLPEGLDDAAGALTETLAVEVHLFRAMTAPLLRCVVVLGAGIQGLLAVQLARLAGASQVLASDLVPQRLALAERMGATTTIQAAHADVVQVILDHTEGWGADLIIDAVGTPITRQQGIAALGPGGTLGLIGLGKGETTLNFLPVVNRELRIQGSYCYSDDDFERALALIETGQIQVKDLIHVAPLPEGAAFFERLLDEPGGLAKVLLNPA